MRIFNHKFKRDFEEKEKYEVGIALTGPEVKSVRAGRIRLEDSFVKILGSEVYLINAEISVYEFARPQGYDSRRTRKLLLHKREIIRLKTKLAGPGGLAIVPVSCYNKDSLIKLEIALAKGRKDQEKRKLEKKRDVALEEKRAAKEFLKS